MFYDKQIRYLEYLENGEKIRSAGFVKIEVIEKVCNIQISVTGLHQRSASVGHAGSGSIRQHYVSFR